LLIFIAALGPVIYQAGSIATQSLQSRNILYDALSIMVWGDYGWLQTAMFYVLGASLILLGTSLLLKFKVKFDPGALSLTLMGIGFIIIGSNYVSIPGTPQTLSGLIHHNTTIAVAALLPLSCFLTAPILKNRGHNSLFIFTIIVAITALLFFTIGGQILTQEMSAFGIYERVLLWLGQLWMEVICGYLLWRSIKQNTPGNIADI